MGENYVLLSQGAKKQNDVYLKAFKTYLKALGLCEQTIKNHIRFANLYINEFLLLYEVHPLKDGCHMLDEFFTDWLIKQDIALSDYQVKSIAASVKKFYAYMLELGLEITNEDFNFLVNSIKEHKDNWLVHHA